VAPAVEVRGVSQLPYTGSEDTMLLVAGLATLGAGAALTITARRRQA
jgi:LPXTG-motif cell wall-anchored protein